MIPFLKKNKDGKKLPKSTVPRTAQESIPFLRMFEDGTCRVRPGYYTRTIQYQDINYQLAQQEDKTAIFEEWCSFLNFFDSSIHFELSFVNTATDSADFEKSIRIPYQQDGFDDVRAEYSQMLRQQLSKGNNGLTKTKFLTYGIEGDSMAQVKPRLEHIQNDLMNNFHRLGVLAKPLDGTERLRLMHGMLNMDGANKFHFNWKDLVPSGLSVKDAIAPTALAFKNSRTFQMGGMLIVQDAVWGRVTANREAGKSTRYYVDEFHLLLKEEQTAAYSVEIWKRFRKWGGIPTGLTQNVKDLLTSPEVSNIFENSDFVYEEDAVTVTDEENGALTPEGNLTLVDDYHTSYSDGSGQQFITLVSKSGNTFYLVIDRNDKGENTVHFMNLVDEADLLSLMEDEDADAYTAEKEAAAQAEQERKQAEEDAKKAAEEAAASGSEQTGGNKVTKYAATFLGVLALVGLVAGGGIYTFMKQKQKKQAEKEALDPDANYTEDKGDFEIPVEDEPEETGEEDTAEE